MSIIEAERLLQQRQLALAEDAFHAAEAHGGDADRCSGGRWTIAMLRGDFEAAWRESDAMRARRSPDPHRMWDGESLDGKRVIVRCLHGFGDAVQMFRYAPALRRLARSVVWEVAPRLVELAHSFDGVDEVVTWGEAAPAVAPAWESQVEVMELPYIFRTVQGSLPITEHYCSVPPEAVHRVGLGMKNSGLRVGVVWAGGEWNPARSLPFSALTPLLTLPGVALWSLQGGAQRQTAPGLRDATALCGDGLPALAATIVNLDVVVSVDTLAAHLAGALGKPVIVMLQKIADWRWMTEGSRTPWYPTMRLTRQESIGDWSSVIRRVCATLSEEFL